MKITDAANLLGLSGNVTPEDAKRAYRQAAKTYHPDRNPAGAEMMKIINAAFDILKDFSGEVLCSEQKAQTASYPEAVNEALNAIIGLDGLEIEICGAWVWIGGNTRTHRAVLKEAGFYFASQKKRWYFRPADWRSSSRGSFTMDDIRDKYGSMTPRLRRDLLERGEAR